MERICRHYNGSYDHPICAAGIRYQRVTPGWERFGAFYRQPCYQVVSQHGLNILSEFGAQGECPRYEPVDGGGCGCVNRYELS